VAPGLTNVIRSSVLMITKNCIRSDEKCIPLTVHLPSVKPFTVTRDMESKENVFYLLIGV
jgi:hypothetical protein